MSKATGYIPKEVRDAEEKMKSTISFDPPVEVMLRQRLDRAYRKIGSQAMDLERFQEIIRRDAEDIQKLRAELESRETKS